MPDGVGKVYYTRLHEPEDEIRDTSLTKKAYIAGWQRLAPHVTAAGMHPLPVLMCRTWQPEVGRDPRAYMVPGIPRLGVDCHLTTKPAGLMGQRIVAFAKARGLWLVTPDIGVDPQHPEAEEKVDAYLAQVEAYSRHTASMWFNAGLATLTPGIAQHYFGRR